MMGISYYPTCLRSGAGGPPSDGIAIERHVVAMGGRSDLYVFREELQMALRQENFRTRPLYSWIPAIRGLLGGSSQDLEGERKTWVDGLHGCKRGPEAVRGISDLQFRFFAGRKPPRFPSNWARPCDVRRVASRGGESL